MIMTGTSKEFAVALFDLAKETGNEQEIFEGLDLIRQVIEKTPEFGSFLDSPAVSKAEKLKILNDTFAKEVHEYVISFISILCENGDIEIYIDCVEDFERLYNDEKNLVHAVVTSVVELNDEEKASLVNILEKKLGSKVETEYKLDSSLLGGVVVEADGKIFDSSLKHRIKTIKEEVMNG